jgi:hypothetical protein
VASCNSDTTCFYHIPTNKCRRSTRGPPGGYGQAQGQGAYGQAQGQATAYKLPTFPGAITIPELEPSNNLGEKTL